MQLAHGLRVADASLSGRADGVEESLTTRAWSLLESASYATAPSINKVLSAAARLDSATARPSSPGRSATEGDVQ